MLKARILTALVLVPLLVSGILWLDNALFSLLIALFALIGAWEWGALMRVQSTGLRVAYVVLQALLMASAWYLWQQQSAIISYILYPAAIWWLIALGMVFKFPQSMAWVAHSGVKAIIGIHLLVPTWAALSVIHSLPQGSYWVLMVLVMVWAADSFAYFGGRSFGKNKLAPLVSPNKTWEGVYSALAGVAVCVLIMLYSFDLGIQGGQAIALFVLVCVVTVVFSIVGDLVESMFKRDAGVKDSGTIFPGHGGVLDRIDSITAAAPLFLLGLGLIGQLSW